ncbi:MAG: alanine--tRNA ligase [Rickettsiaceae bacterium]
MTKLTTAQIRNTFLDYFVKNGHTHVASSSLVPQNDPTLMFTNSGMVQFKDVFTGLDKRDYNRATSSQKCVRAGGKHNDLDNVGYTARHHTFFEMLGNFSFGNYFKEEAIYYAWNLLTKDFSLSKEKLYVTVFHDDDEAVNYWKKIANLSDDRIIRIATSDNFWSMGDTGPCGPCSEIFYDHGDKVFGGLPGTKDEDGDRYIEIWNLVFMQFEQINKDTRIELPKKSVDTGMGLERIAAVIQGVHDNYDIDLFQEIIGHTESILKVKAKGEALFSYRVIADHLRSSAFLIADGVMPSNEGRGYVLRRIMRRAMRHAHQLGASEPLMYKLLPKLVDLFAHTFPEITRAEEFVSSVLKQEEERFKVTLDRGLKLLEDETIALSSKSELSGEVAFKLYDTYGFPLDLTQDILKKKNLTINITGFDQMMDQQKQRARSAWSGSGESRTDNIWFDILSEFGSTEFLGYSLDSSEAKVLAVVSNGKRVRQISEKGKNFTLITNQTPFYGESGGQMGDIGFITSGHGKMKVLNTLKYLGKIHAHVCEMEEGLITENDEIKLTIDTHYRNYLRMHHSATHVLHAVLRDILGNHIAQKGSLVAHDRLRFDISHSNNLTRAEIDLIEDKVNKIIIDNSIVHTNLMSTDSAIESGAMALFGEKYENEVRVVSMGNEDDKDNSYSFELCGGTHVSRTGDIGIFKIISEGAIAAGVRRIEAVCGMYAISFIRENEKLLENIINTLKTNKHDAVQKIDSLINSKKLLEKDLEKNQLEKLSLTELEINKIAKSINNIKLVYKQLENIDTKLLRMSTQNTIKNQNSLILVYTSKQEDKLSLLIAVSKNITQEYNAGSIIKKLSIFIGGSGGGQADLAQAGTNDFTKLGSIGKELIRILEHKDF